MALASPASPSKIENTWRRGWKQDNEHTRGVVRALEGALMGKVSCLLPLNFARKRPQETKDPFPNAFLHPTLKKLPPVSLEPVFTHFGTPLASARDFRNPKWHVFVAPQDLEDPFWNPFKDLCALREVWAALL